MAPARAAQDFLPLSPLSAAILLAIAGGAQHGYAITKEIERQSGGRQVPGAGSLYAALRRMVEEGLLEETEASADGEPNARRQYYSSTELGREVVRLEMLRLAGLVATAAERDLVPELRGAFRRVEAR
jgi:DNA-binding PadR family transcriptional regulator